MPLFQFPFLHSPYLPKHHSRDADVHSLPLDEPLLRSTVPDSAPPAPFCARRAQYADNILKTFATAISILITCLLSPAGVTARFIQGMALVVASLPMYNERLVAAARDLLPRRTPEPPLTTPLPPPHQHSHDDHDNDGAGA